MERLYHFIILLYLTAIGEIDLKTRVSIYSKSTHVYLDIDKSIWDLPQIYREQLKNLGSPLSPSAIKILFDKILDNYWQLSMIFYPIVAMSPMLSKELIREIRDDILDKIEKGEQFTIFDIVSRLIDNKEILLNQSKQYVVLDDVYHVYREHKKLMPIEVVLLSDYDQYLLNAYGLDSLDLILLMYKKEQRPSFSLSEIIQNLPREKLVFHEAVPSFDLSLLTKFCDEKCLATILTVAAKKDLKQTISLLRKISDLSYEYKELPYIVAYRLFAEDQIDRQMLFSEFQGLLKKRDLQPRAAMETILSNMTSNSYSENIQLIMSVYDFLSNIYSTKTVISILTEAINLPDEYRATTRSKFISMIDQYLHKISKENISEEDEIIL